MLHQEVPSHVEPNEQGILFWARNEVQRNLIEESGMSEIDWVQQFAGDYAIATTTPAVQQLFLKKDLNGALREILKHFPQFKIGRLH